MKARATWLWVVVLVVVFAACGIAAAADEVKVNINDLVSETQKMDQSTDEMVLVWWIPEEYWTTSFKDDPSMTEEQREEFISVLRPYTVIVAVEGKMGAFGGVTYRPEKEIRDSIKLVDRSGTSYKPLKDEDLSADARNFLGMVKPVFENMLGPMGQNMHFIMFPAKGSDGKLIASAKEEGSFTVVTGGKDFKWRLPLGSLLPPKVCPVDGEKLSGAWKYCPWHGAKLEPMK